MDLTTAEPDVATLVRRIQEDMLDLQPDFQRGQVWPVQKQQKLIDSILRGWQIPPVHVVKVDDRPRVLQQVLDGQQRLRAIVNFVEGEFAVDGSVTPLDQAIKKLDGKHYADLPADVRDQFDYYTIRVIELRNFEPEEPFELFYRWNEATVLTAAEKRNALFGEPRHQVHSLVQEFGDPERSARRLGFSNARMAYDDVVARFLVTLELGTLREYVSAERITTRFREARPFQSQLMNRAFSTIGALLSFESLSKSEVRLTKATTHTWACSLARFIEVASDIDQLTREYDLFLGWFEGERKQHKKHGQGQLFDPVYSVGLVNSPLFDMFNDRASARVADVTSVLARDAIVTLFFLSGDAAAQFRSEPSFRALWSLHEEWSTREEFFEAEFLTALDRISWGRL